MNPDMNLPMKCLLAPVVLAIAGHAQHADFYACHTRLEYHQPQDPALLGQIPVNAARVFAGQQADPADRVPRPPREGVIRWGPYSDLLVNVAAGRRLVFARAASYLPYLETPKGRFPLQALADCRPDPLCLCSFVRIVESQPDRIVVHWRHVPDPASVVMTEVVHELFTISPAGTVRREVRAGTPRIEDYHDPANVTIQDLALTDDGIVERSLTKAARSNPPIPAVAGAPVRPAPVPEPALGFQFDDGLRANRGETRELVSGTCCPIIGNKALWKSGVSGTALAFDGYFSKIELPKAMTPALTDELTVEAWVALGAYPWNDAGIVHCSAGSPIGAEDYKHGYRDPYTYRPWSMAGYMLGIDPYGRPIFKLNGRQVGGGVLEPEATVPPQAAVPTYRWTHLAGTYGNGRMCLYVDGRLAASEAASGPIKLPDRNLLIGLNGDAERVSDPVSHSKRAANNNLPLVYGIEGLIDEVRIHAQALSADDVRASYEAFCPAPAAVTAPDLERRVLPGTVTGRPAEKFGASCATLRFHELWDNLWRTDPYRDIVVGFDTVPGRVVFWQGINSGSGWVTENNKWMADQSWEIGGPHGCAEHMADKRGRFNHVRLIENTDARVVVHWRYASIDVGYVFGRTGVWADEYYTIYPDGVGVRWVEGINNGWHDTQFLSEPGTTCLDNIEMTALTVADTTGRSEDLTWQMPNRIPGNPLADACIKRINFKSKWKVFAIYQEGVRISQWGENEQSKHTPDPFAGPWNHWPVGLNPSDGRYAVSNDRVTHAALGAPDPTGCAIMHGFTDQPAASLAVLAKSWNHPPAVEEVRNCESQGYDRNQRAYVLTATARPVSLTLRGSKDSPIHHPCLVIENWDSTAAARVRIDGKELAPGKVFRQGVVRTPSGGTTLILYFDLQSESSAHFEIQQHPIN
jgi:hypothetical protein